MHVATLATRVSPSQGFFSLCASTKYQHIASAMCVVYRVSCVSCAVVRCVADLERVVDGHHLEMAAEGKHDERYREEEIKL